jgi:hypothetical protein
MIDHITDHALMTPALPYESTFTDTSPQRPETMFASGQVHDLVLILNHVRSTALTV